MVAMVAWVAFECNRCGHPSLALWSLVGGPKEFAKPRPFADVQSSLRVQVSFPFLPGPSLLLGKVFFFGWRGCHRLDRRKLLQNCSGIAFAKTDGGWRGEWSGGLTWHRTPLRSSLFTYVPVWWLKKWENFSSHECHRKACPAGMRYW
jgi:hypothetical protein